MYSLFSLIFVILNSLYGQNHVPSVCNVVIAFTRKLSHHVLLSAVLPKKGGVHLAFLVTGTRSTQI